MSRFSVKRMSIKICGQDTPPPVNNICSLATIDEPLTEFGLRVDLKLPNAPYERLALRKDTEILLQEPPNGLLLLNARGCQFHGFVVWYFLVRLHQYFRLFLVPQNLPSGRKGIRPLGSIIGINPYFRLGYLGI